MSTVMLICALQFFVNTDLGIPFQVKENVEGRLLKESDSKYLIDFTQGLKKYKALSGKPEDYNKVLVDKTECIKE
jgi:hypothetical protein